MEIVLSGAIGINLFVAFQLLRKRGLKAVSIKIALALQCVWVLRFILILVKLNPTDAPIPALVAYDQTFYVLDGLFIWLFSRSMYEKELQWRKVWIHFIPFFLLFSYSTVGVLFFPERISRNYEVVRQSIEVSRPIDDLPSVLYIFFLLGVSTYYLVKSVQVAKRYNRVLLDQYSTVDNLGLSWVITFQRSWIILFLIPISLYFSNYIHPIVEVELVGGLIFICFCTLSIIFSTYMIQQEYRVIAETSKPLSAHKPEALSDKQREQIRALEQTLKDEKYYLDEELSLADLAGHLGIKPPELTQIIKLSSYDSFYDLINSFRFEAVKSKLLQSDEQIIQLAYQNGFRNKSTFNKIFKEKTGLTPKEYRNRHK